jgi:hypothetical protein
VTLELAGGLSDAFEAFVSMRTDQTEYLDELLCWGAEHCVGRERGNSPQ